MKSDNHDLTNPAERTQEPPTDDAWGEEPEKSGARRLVMPTLVTFLSVAAAFSIWNKLANAAERSVKPDFAINPVIVFTPTPQPFVPTPTPTPPPETIQVTPNVPDHPTPPDNTPKTAMPQSKGPGIMGLAPGNSTLVRPSVNNGSGPTQAQRDFGMQVANTIENALRRHPIAKTLAGIAPKVRAAVSGDGVITGLTLESSTGNPTLDKIIAEELTNIRTPGITPKGIKFITVRISLHRPN